MTSLLQRSLYILRKNLIYENYIFLLSQLLILQTTSQTIRRVMEGIREQRRNGAEYPIRYNLHQLQFVRTRNGRLLIRLS
jgi:hypothetical protein